MRLRKIRLGTQSILVNWLISYISVLFVPIVISMILYTATWHVVESEVNRANEAILQQVEQAIDNNLSGIQRLSVEMALSKRLGGFINVPKPFSDSDYYDIVSLAGDLRIYKMANDFIEEIYVYYKNSDTVVSTREHINSRKLFEAISGQDDGNVDHWNAFFGKRYIQEYAPVTLKQDEQPTKAVMYAKSILLDNPEQPGAVILFIINESKLLENIRSMNETTIAVIDKDNRLIASNGPMDSYPELIAYDKLTDNNGLLYGEMSGEEVAVSYTTSKNSAWKYVTIVPSELFDEKMKYVKKLIYISITLCILIGGLVTFVFIHRNYNPMNSLIRSLSSLSGISFEKGSNEYGYLQAALNNTLAEKEKIGQRLEQHRNAIRSHFLQGLLKGRLDQNVPVYEALAAHNIQTISPDFAVLLFQVDDYGKFNESGFEKSQKVKLVHFIIMNVAEEVAGDGHNAMATEIDDMLACIINLQDGHEAGETTRIAEHIKQFVRDHYHIRLTIAVSGIHQDLEGISRAHQDALAGLEYRLVMGSGEIIRYEDLPKGGLDRESTCYYYPLHTEQQLINLVKTGDYEKSKALIDEVIDINVSDASLSVSMAKFLMFDLISTMLKTIDEIGAGDKREFMNKVNAVDRLTACKTIKEMKIQIGDVLRQVCQSIQEERKQESNQLSQQVIAFVREHYSSDSLNITMIGDAFRLTPSYLSKQFKAQTGEALLEFINKTRIEEAKRLLSEEACSIMEIARRVGYADINTFNRVFKKYEGVTPGKYKDIV